MSNKNFAIFVSSADSYCDLWPVFFALFKKNWPEYSGIIYLQTQNNHFSFPGLNIICTNVGHHKEFGQTLLSGLDKIPENNVLFMMIDYLLMDKVNHQKILEYFGHFLNSNLDSLVLGCHNWENTKKSVHPDFQGFLPPSNKILFSYQVAFWKKNVLQSVVLPHENPWLSEWYGDARAVKMRLRIESLLSGIERPIIYDPRGCLHQGKWLDNAVDYLKKNGFSINYQERGLYSEDEVYKSLRFRIWFKWQLFYCGIRGSYFDLLVRKSIH